MKYLSNKTKYVSFTQIKQLKENSVYALKIVSKFTIYIIKLNA